MTTPIGLRVRGARLLLGVILIGAPLFVGSAHPAVVGAEAVTLALAAALAIPAPGRSIRIGLLGALLVAGVVWTALQLVPLPGALLNAVSPGAHRIRIAGPLLHADGWAPITLDGAATAGALAQGLAFLALFFSIRNSWSTAELRSESGPLRLVAISSVVGCGAALAHAVVGAETVFGVYSPLARRGGLVSLPLVNANHLAGLANLGALGSVGLALIADGREKRLTWVACGLFCGITTALTMSRGGMTALVLGCAFMLFLAPPRPVGLRRKALALATVVCTFGTYVLLKPLRAWLSTFLDLQHVADSEKVTLLADAARLSLAYPLAGVGRGSFVIGFVPFSRQARTIAFTHPESLPLQLACEWGIPFAAVFLGVGASAWISAARSTHMSAPRAAALAGVLAVTAQNLVDFSLEIAAVAFPTLTCLAIGIRSSAPRRRQHPMLPRALVTSSWLALALVAVSAGRLASGHGFDADGQKLRLMVDRGVGARRLTTEGRRLMRAHPADAYIPLQIARGLVKTRPRASLPYLNRALWLDPRSPGAHLITGRALLRLGLAEQAVLHYRAAAQWNPSLAGVVATEVAALVRSPDTALRFVPSGEGGLGLLQTLAQTYLGKADNASALQLALELDRRSRRAPYARAFLARVYVASGRYEDAVAAARATHGTESECEGASYEATAFQNLGLTRAASDILRSATRRCPDDLALRAQLVLHTIDSRDWQAAERALEAYRGAAGITDSALAHGYYLQGRLELARKRHLRAAAAFQRAADLEPSSEQYLIAAMQAWKRVDRQDRVEPLRRALSRLPR